MQPSEAQPASALAYYDGSAGTLVDSNVWIDCIDAGSAWHDWSVDRLQACAAESPLHVNLIVYTELLVARPDVASLDALLDVLDTQRTALPWGCAALAATAFGRYRRNGGARRTPLPDFYIGAHAAVANLAVLTRDPRGYRSYFPRLRLIAPTPERGPSMSSRRCQGRLAISISGRSPAGVNPNTRP